MSKEDNPYTDAEDLSLFMNNATAWYLVSNLPGLYLKHLASENGTVLERLKNCLYVIKFILNFTRKKELKIIF